jgi:hypothetical protein
MDSSFYELTEESSSWRVKRNGIFIKKKLILIISACVIGLLIILPIITYYSRSCNNTQVTSSVKISTTVTKIIETTATTTISPILETTATTTISPILETTVTTTNSIIETTATTTNSIIETTATTTDPTKKT